MTSPLRLLASAAILCSTLAAGPTPLSITIATYGKGIGSWCFAAAEYAHYFDQAGVAVAEPTVVYGDPAIVSALTSGQADIAIGSIGAIVPVANGQTDQIVVIASSEGAPLTLVGPKDVTSVSQLAGKTIALTSHNGSNTIISEAMINEAVGTGKWTALYTGGSSGSRLAEITAGKADAGILSDPFDLTSAGGGLHVLTRFGSRAVYWNGPVFSTRNWLRDNHDGAVRFLTALAKGCDFILDPKNKDAAVGLLAKDSDVSSAAASDAYAYWVAGPGRDKGIPHNAMVDVPGFANSMRAMKGAGVITNGAWDYRRALDTRYLEEAIADAHLR